MSPPEHDDHEDVGLAAEYALGVLDAGERRSAAARLETDAEFRAAVAAWEDGLHPLTDEVATVAAPDGLWRRIERSLEGSAARAAPLGSRPTRPGGVWRSLTFWRGATAGMGALAAASLAFALVGTGSPVPRPERRASEGQPPMMVANLAPENGPVAFIVAYDPMRRTTLVTPLTRDQVDRVHELWVIPADGTPRSLGVIRMDSAARYAVPEALQPFVGGDGTLAVSLEPTGGSPTGAPTGPVVASGPLSRV